MQMKRATLFLTGLVQVYFIAINTYFIAQKYLIGAFMASFTISFIWSFNVKNVAFGTTKDRLAYSAGAAIGTVLGILTSATIIKFIS